MKEQIKRWFMLNNGHVCDDQRFYDIVISSVDNKVEYKTFEEAIRECKEDVTDSQINDIYKRYVDLRGGLIYYTSKN